MKIIRLESWLMVCAVLLSACVGCSSLSGKLSDPDGRFNLLKRLNNKKDQEPEFMIPKSMVGIWKASTFEKPGSQSIRGFGGRFYFYDANNQPVRVNGELTIYGYDDHNQSEYGEGKADRKFVFKADSLNNHFSESALGESYSFFVPWDKVGGEQKTITLIPVFKTVDGHIPEAKAATIRLPGKRPSKMSASDVAGSGKKSAGPVVQASAESPTELSPGTTIISPILRKKKVRRMPTTLRLTPHLAEHFSAPVQRTTNSLPASTDDLSKEAQPTSVGSTYASSEDVDDKAKRAPDVGRIDKVAPTRVFGQPGAFR